MNCKGEETRHSIRVGDIFKKSCAHCLKITQIVAFEFLWWRCNRWKLFLHLAGSYHSFLRRFKSPVATFHLQDNKYLKSNFLAIFKHRVQIEKAMSRCKCNNLFNHWLVAKKSNSLSDICTTLASKWTSNKKLRRYIFGESNSQAIQLLS